MRKVRKTKSKRTLKYQQVPIAELKRRRHGKHHHLMEGIFAELEDLKPGCALKIPFLELEGVTRERLRAAAHRRAVTRKVKIETLADRENFYLWKRNAPSNHNGNGHKKRHSPAAV